MAIFYNFSLTSNHLHPLQVENCESNSRLVVDEDDYGKFKLIKITCFFHIRLHCTPVSQILNSCHFLTRITQSWCDKTTKITLIIVDISDLRVNITTLKYFCINFGNKGVFCQFEIVINVLVGSSCFI